MCCHVASSTPHCFVMRNAQDLYYILSYTIFWCLHFLDDLILQVWLTAMACWCAPHHWWQAQATYHTRHSRGRGIEGAPSPTEWGWEGRAWRGEEQERKAQPLPLGSVSLGKENLRDSESVVLICTARMTVPSIHWVVKPNIKRIDVKWFKNQTLLSKCQVAWLVSLDRQESVLSPMEVSRTRFRFKLPDDHYGSRWLLHRGMWKGELQPCLWPFSDRKSVV